ncbi:hypothetical protein EJ08DRAFT_93190 [Tothia fuscella]|uniref:Uncharacterized protein n=1 Tax=Tothia fuscella TaxID=1048955 RepID=A0A9P4NWT3_9PEZI|nr:hypothetical protein EJ08DRAFT_93190 [Tothia fuscella]
MLPPVAPAVLERNPRFKALYTNLASSRLNNDASTRLIKQQRAQADVEKNLVVARKEDAKATLLQEALDSISRRASELPPELLETCQIVSAQLNGELDASDLEILGDDVDYFISHTPLVATAISQHLQQSALLLAKIITAADTTTNSTNATSPSISKLPAQGSALQECIQNQTMSIAMTRTRVTELSDQTHAAYRELFEASVRVIEQTIQGSVARGVKARAEHLAAVAKGMELKLQVLAQTDPVLTDPLLHSALRAYSSHLSDTEFDLASRESAAEKSLRNYESAKGMADIAKRYGQLLTETEDVKREIKTLEASRGGLSLW